MSDIERKARDLRELIDQYWDLAYAEGLQRRDQDTADGDAQRVSMEIDSAIQSIVAITPPEQFPEGWHLSERATCYVLSEGNNVVGNFVGPDAEQNASLVARMLAARPEVK